jgi:glycosyltransferase involved in cell wall biosynthesis
MPTDAPTQGRTIVILGGGTIVSGKEIMMINLARGLRGAGYRPVFVTSMWGGKDEFVSRLDAENFKYFRVRSGFISKTLRWKPMLWTAIQLLYWPVFVMGYLRAIKVSAPIAIIHTNWHHALLLLPFLDRHRDFYWSHEIIGDARHYRWIFQAIAKRVARVACVSQAVARSMERAGVPAERISVVYNGISFDCAVAPPRTDLPLRLGIVGQIGPWKGHDDALAALAQLPSGSAVLKIFGSGQDDYAAELKHRAHVLGISDRVEWCGFVSGRASIYEGIDVCLIVSRFADPLPTVALEAGLAARPTICTNLGGLSEIVLHQVTGLHVPAHRPDLLANAVKEFVAQPKSLITMGCAAKIRVQNEFSSTRFTQRFIEVISKAAKPLSTIAQAYS